MKITWHVDDLKVYHADKDIVGAFIQYTNETYEDIIKVNPSRVIIHDCLSMTLD